MDLPGETAFAMLALLALGIQVVHMAARRAFGNGDSNKRQKIIQHQDVVSTRPNTPPSCANSEGEDVEWTHKYKGPSKEQVLQRRRRVMGSNQSISYSADPLMIIRGEGSKLYDETGRQYLDCVNNVAHVGHCHPKVVKATCAQMHALNTNTRYLHPARTEYIEKLLSTFPEELSVCFLTNSGSESNDLALRMARAYTKQEDVIILGTAYHGHTTSLIECSPYKYEGPGGVGPKSHVHKVPYPCTYRGVVRRCHKSPGPAFAEYVREAVQGIKAKGRGPAALMAESMLSCAGQVIPPEGYLREAFRHVREAGGVCIADEVQVGFGRVGSHFWAFQAQGVVPDIVTLGKPMGNGYPIGAVVTTRAVADAFANGMEYFNTYGGATAACVVGMAVLDVVLEERLQEHARKLGISLLDNLRCLQERHPLVGDVRGAGLFLGMELVEDHGTQLPAADKAAAVAMECRHRGVLVSTDGPHHNVIKIKPPMCFSQGDADLLVATLDTVLSEVEGGAAAA